MKVIATSDELISHVLSLPEPAHDLLAIMTDPTPPIGIARVTDKEEAMFDEEEDENQRIEVMVTGRHLGTASGWDEVDDWTVFFYDYQPNEIMIALGVPAGGLTINYIYGTFEIDDRAPMCEIIFSGDLVTLLRDIPTAVTIEPVET